MRVFNTIASYIPGTDANHQKKMIAQMMKNQRANMADMNFDLPQDMPDMGMQGINKQAQATEILKRLNIDTDGDGKVSAEELTHTATTIASSLGISLEIALDYVNQYISQQASNFEQLKKIRSEINEGTAQAIATGLATISDTKAKQQNAENEQRRIEAQNMAHNNAIKINKRKNRNLLLTLFGITALGTGIAVWDKTTNNTTPDQRIAQAAGAVADKAGEYVPKVKVPNTIANLLGETWTQKCTAIVGKKGPQTALASNTKCPKIQNIKTDYNDCSNAQKGNTVALEVQYSEQNGKQVPVAKRCVVIPK